MVYNKRNYTLIKILTPLMYGFPVIDFMISGKVLPPPNDFNEHLLLFFHFNFHAFTIKQRKLLLRCLPNP